MIVALHSKEDENTAHAGRRASCEAKSGEKPTLAIIVGVGWGIRNYLLSETFDVIKQHFRPLIVSHYSHLSDFRAFCEGHGAAVASLPLDSPPKTPRILLRFAENAFLRRHPTVSHGEKLKRKSEPTEKKSGLRGKVWKAMEKVSHPILFPPLRSIFKASAVRSWSAVREMRDLFQKENVVAVFSTNMSERTEWPASLAAESMGLPVVAAITSWDNPSTKKFPPCDYDAYLVWGEDMRDQLRKYMGVEDLGRIHIVGAPQFDFYLDQRYQQSREEFCRPLGLDPKRKIIVYATVTPGIIPDNPELIRQLHGVLRSRRFSGDPQILVRLHPKDRIERYEHLRKDPAFRDITWTLAGDPKIEGKDQWCPNHDDLVRAVNTVRHGDVNVHAGYSTMILDFASVNKPVVLIGFDSTGETSLCRFWETYEHLVPVMSSGAVEAAYDLDQLATYIESALARPEARAPQRAALTRLELGSFDGGSGHRAGQVIVDVIEKRLQRAKRVA
ncbi:MAG: hypothetical protein U1D30_00760 [Planctomycetota bacterium]